MPLRLSRAPMAVLKPPSTILLDTHLIIPKRLLTHPFAIDAEVAERLPRHVIRYTMIGYRVQQRFDVAHCLVESVSCP